MTRHVVKPGSPRAWLWLAYAGLVFAFTWPVLSTGAALGISDWDPLLFLHASVLKSGIQYGQWPFWNPWYCGGDVLWQNPQVSLLTPVYPLALAVGIVRAMKATIWIHYLAGLIGMHVLLTRGIGLRSSAWLLFLGTAVTFAGGAALHVAVGHVTFLTYFYLPWLLFFAVRAATSEGWRHAIGGAIVFALMIWNGGTHMAFMAALSCSAFLAVAALLQRTWRPVSRLVAIGALAVLLSAPKLLPVLAFVTQPGIVDIRYFPPQPDAFSSDMFVHALMDPFQYHRLRFPGQNYRWHEYGNYFGNLGLLLVIASLCWTLLTRPTARQHWLRVSLAATSLLLLGLALGEIGAWAPYSLLHHVPVFSQFRVPSRYLLVFTPFALLLVGCVVRDLSADEVPADARRWIALALLLSMTFVSWRNSTLLRGAFPFEPLDATLSWMSEPPAPVVDSSTNGFTENSPMLRAVFQDRAVLRCNEPLQLAGTLDPHQPIVFSPDAAISHIRFTPNRIEFRALAGPQGGRVFMNQKYSPGWTSSAGSLAVDAATQLSYVTLSPNAAGRFDFRFRPPRLILGWILWTLGVAIAGLMWMAPRRTR